jgi:hypothetical protein
MVKNSIMDLTSRSEVVSILDNYVRTVDELLQRDAAEASERGEILVH